MAYQATTAPSWSRLSSESVLSRTRKQAVWRFAVLLMAAFIGSAQTNTSTFRSAVSLVRVDAQVTKGDQIVSGLKKEDFRIIDNGTEQEIRYFAEEEDNLDLVLVLDTSGSMKEQVLRVSEGALDALKQLKPGDRVAVTRFTIRARLESELNENLEEAARTIRRIAESPFRGGTNIHGAFEHAAVYLMKTPRSNRRRAILLVSDGESMAFSKKTTVLRKLWESDSVVNALIVKKPKILGGSSIGMKLHGVKVEEFTDETGGEYLKTGKIDDGFKRILERIRKRYSLHYALPEGSEGESRTLRVELSNAAKRAHRGAHVRARKGYVWRGWSPPVSSEKR